MENMELKNPDKNFWKGKKVFITGHTGFKGSWLCLFLNYLNADIYGYALEPPTKPSLYMLCNMDEFVKSAISDIRDIDALKKSIEKAQPEIIIHMAAQSLVRQSYLDPVLTYQTNIMGTINLLEVVRTVKSIKAVINVTTDKCYENREWIWPYRENEPLGGYDPYSSSKACSEIITAAYRSSYFNPNKYNEHRVSIATARAGNVIGGGDWATDRLIPDFIRAISKGEKVKIRSPHAIRPWQHVLEPLTGYLLLAEKLYAEGSKYAEAWNFGPKDEDAKPVEWIVNYLCKNWGSNASFTIDKNPQLHEANYLKLDWSKAKTYLNWYPRWSLVNALDSIINFSIAYFNKKNVKDVCQRQITEYLND